MDRILRNIHPANALTLVLVVALVTLALLGAIDPVSAGTAGALYGAGMTTLAANSPRAFEIGDRNEFPVVASDILYEGSAIGLTTAGHARPLVAGDRFVGFAEAKADNSAGSAAAINVRVIESGKVTLAISGAVISDVSLPVYASDDDTFSLNPAAGSFIGFVHGFVSSGVVKVKFNAPAFFDPHGSYTLRETKTGNYTVDAEDTGKLICVTANAIITLPANGTAVGEVTVLNAAPAATIQVALSPNAADKIQMPDITAVDDKDYINTLATSCRGDRAKVQYGHADGPNVIHVVGTWAKE